MLCSKRGMSTCNGFRLLSVSRSSWIRPGFLPASPFPSVSDRSCSCKFSQSCLKEAISTLVAEVLFNNSCLSFINDLEVVISIRMTRKEQGTCSGPSRKSFLPQGFESDVEDVLRSTLSYPMNISKSRTRLVLPAVLLSRPIRAVERTYRKLSKTPAV